MNARARMMAAGILATTGLHALAQSQPTPTPEIVPEAPRHLDSTPAVEVVFVLDTTGSMSGLIEGAKSKIWSIANSIATANPRPVIRMGLVAYRDRGDEYITRLTSLTDDLDAVYADLMGFQAAGGGDGPESVNQALNEAVTGFDWSREATTLRLIYLVGDAPPHMDYENDVTYSVSCEAAASAGIIINTIQCGSLAEATAPWQAIARLAEGEYFAIDQSGGVAVVGTPFDAELATLSRELDETLVFYGGEQVLAAQSAKMALAEHFVVSAGDGALADRAAYRCRDIDGATFLGVQELVADCGSGKVTLEKLEKNELPEALRSLSIDELKAYLDAKGKQRDGVRARMLELSAERDALLAEHSRRHAGSFDRSVLEALRKQALRAGIRYDLPDVAPTPDEPGTAAIKENAR